MSNIRRPSKNTAAGNAAQSDKKATFDWTTDDDVSPRTCTVTWYRRVCPTWGIVDHWALTFDWNDYEATYEADDHKGYLIPRWNQGGPEPGVKNYTWIQEKEFPGKFLSPRDVNQIAKSVHLNGAKYYNSHSNSYEWVGGMCEKLDIHEPRIIIPMDLPRIDRF